MYRCIQLASKGRGYTSPNPMVGAVVVYNDTIIGEGYHRRYGEAHAEVNAINSVRDKSLLSKSTLYVSLEPCSHYGKTPPCAQLIIDSKIPQVVVGSFDPFPEVSGRGVKMLENAGVKVCTEVLGSECKALNKEFFTVYIKGRPYVYLKWAQSADGFMDKLRTKAGMNAAPISNNFTKMLVHKLRAETDAIMIATNTAEADNPSLTTRHWVGRNPTRVILDRSLRLSDSLTVFDGAVETLIVTETENLPDNKPNLEYISVKYDKNFISKLLQSLKKRGILSVMIEGGSQFLQSVIDSDIWDEAFVETSKEVFGAGVHAPVIRGTLVGELEWEGSKQSHFSHSQI